MNDCKQAGISQKAQGFYRVLVVDDKTGKIVSETEWLPNLILNQGMESVAARVWANCFTYAICGTGTRANTVGSSTDTAAQSGTTVTKTGAVLDFTDTDADIGDMIKWASGEEARITSITGANACEVTPSQSVSDGAFTIYHTAQVGLQTETKRSNSYLAGTGNCETTLSGATIQMRRTMDFTTEVGLVTYTEIGVGWSSSLSTTVFSRILLGSPVAVDVGQKLRVVYQLNVTIGPSVALYKNLPVGGWPVAPSTSTYGYECIQIISMSAVNTSGNSSTYQGVVGGPAGGGDSLEPACDLTTGGSTGTGFAISPVSTALAAFGSAVSRATNASLNATNATQAAYTPLSFYVDRTVVFGVAEGVRSDLRSVMMGYRYGAANYYPYTAASQAFTFLFDEAQTKTNTQTLSFTVRISWGRVLA